METITIELREFQRLVMRSAKLSALEDAGVDNWGGYEEAIRCGVEDDLDDEES